ncbi:MAG TPA: hypothetical protein VGO92_01145, partial [Acidimicrobiales bacterium]|nr:hypothetical protein [Acidimicrobiales bacterium]
PFFAAGARDGAGGGDGGDRQVRVEDNVLLDGDARVRLDVNPVAARALGDWFGFVTSRLEQVREWASSAGSSDQPTRVQLWPEHFDVAVDLGAEGRRANFGGSPGDEGHPEPYLYVGPWEPRRGAFWNEPFGASLAYSDLLAGADPLAFYQAGREALLRD